MTFLDERKAKEQITKSVRDLCTMKITLPLGNPSLKRVHTNQFCWVDLPEDFVLENFELIGSKLNSSDGRYSGFVTNRWYIEGVTVTNDGDDAKMELTLNPFATAISKYKDDYQTFTKNYTDAVQSNTKTTTTTASSNKKTTKTETTADKKKKIQTALKEVGKLMEKKKYKRRTYSDYKNFVKYGYGDCWAGAYFIACQLQKRGVKARILNYPTAYSDNHRHTQYKNEKGKWKDFPYRSYKIHSWFWNYKSKGRVISNNCPKKL